MSVLDIILISVVVAFTVVSAAWGLVRQVIALGGLILGLVLAGSFSQQLAPALGFISDPVVARGAAFVIIVVGVSLIASTIASVLYFMVGLLFLGWLDALLGAVLGFIQGWLATAVILVGAVFFFPTWTLEQLQQSILASKVFGALAAIALLFAPPQLKDVIQTVSNQLK
jgi:membrane protein required for colicin V production